MRGIGNSCPVNSPLDDVGNEATTAADCGVDAKLSAEASGQDPGYCPMITLRLTCPIITFRESAIISLEIEISGVGNTRE